MRFYLLHWRPGTSEKFDDIARKTKLSKSAIIHYVIEMVPENDDALRKLFAGVERTHGCRHYSPLDNR